MKGISTDLTQNATVNDSMVQAEHDQQKLPKPKSTMNTGSVTLLVGEDIHSGAVIYVSILMRCRLNKVEVAW
jgi:hypothetical protein